MKSKAKNREKTRKIKSTAIPYEEAEVLLKEALKAEPRDLKVPISLRLDGDIYLELKRLAEEGHGDGKYQGFLNQILRNYLFGEIIKAQPKTKRA